MSDQMPIISVIVPVYKVEPYLHQCVDSILAQTFTDFELILVDDGSPDNCGKICDTYAEQDPRVRVIHQENGGLSAARNAGIDAANGAYLTFIDSDDWVVSDYLKKLYSCIKDYTADVAICDKVEFWNDDFRALDWTKNVGETICISGSEAAKRVYCVGTGVSIVACAKLFSYRLFEQLRFPVGKIHEDQAVIPILLYTAKVVVVSNYKAYMYRQHPDSIMRTGFSTRHLDDIEAIESCISYFKENNETEIVNLAEKAKKRVMARYILKAHDENVLNEFPREYQISVDAALRILEKNSPQDYFTEFLSKYHPHLVRPYCYWHRILRLFRIEK